MPAASLAAFAITKRHDLSSLMNNDAACLELVSLSSEHGKDRETVLFYGAQLAVILNTDEGLPLEIRHKPDAPPETAESVLSLARKWRLEKNAMLFAIVLDGGIVAGLISLSHIGTQTSCARTGYFLTSKYQGQGYGTKALSQLLNIARIHGIRRVSSRIPKANAASRRMWEKCGVPIEFGEDEITAILDNGV